MHRRGGPGLLPGRGGPGSRHGSLCARTSRFRPPDGAREPGCRGEPLRLPEDLVQRLLVRRPGGHEPPGTARRATPESPAPQGGGRAHAEPVAPVQPHRFDRSRVAAIRQPRNAQDLHAGARSPERLSVSERGLPGCAEIQLGAARPVPVGCGENPGRAATRSGRSCTVVAVPLRGQTGWKSAKPWSKPFPHERTARLPRGAHLRAERIGERANGRGPSEEPRATCRAPGLRLRAPARRRRRPRS